MKYFFALLLIPALLTACKNAAKEEPPAPTVPPVATIQPTATPAAAPPPAASPTFALPAFRMLNAGNQVIDLQSYRGKKVFVNLWATWCPPCRAEIPSIESLAAKVDKNKVAFVMLSLDDNFEKAKSYAEKNNMKLPVFYPAGAMPPLFTVDGIPVTFIFNEKGEIIFQQVGSANYDTKAFADMLNK